MICDESATDCRCECTHIGHLLMSLIEAILDERRLIQHWELRQRFPVAWFKTGFFGQIGEQGFPVRKPSAPTDTRPEKQHEIPPNGFVFSAQQIEQATLPQNPYYESAALTTAPVS